MKNLLLGIVLLLITINYYANPNLSEQQLENLAETHKLKGNLDSSIYYLNKALDLRLKSKDSSSVIDLYFGIGYIYTLKGEYKLASQNFNSAKLFFNDSDTTDLSFYHLNMGFIYDNQGILSEALVSYYKSLQLNQQIGYIYQSQNDFEKSLNHYNKALTIFNELSDTTSIITMLNNIGKIYIETNNLYKSEEKFKTALSLAVKKNDKVGIAYSYKNIGLIKENSKQYQEALIYYKKSYEIFKSINYKKDVSKCLFLIGKINFKLDNISISKNQVEQSLRLAQEVGSPNDIQNTSKLLSDIYLRTNQPKLAYQMLALHLQMKDSVTNTNILKTSIQQKTKYDYEIKKARDEAKHQKEITIEQKAKEKQTLITYFAVGVIVLVLTFLIIVFNRLHVTRKQKNIIFNQKQVVEKAHELLEEKNKEITDNINYAKQIQHAILPTELIKSYLNNYFVIYKPKDIVSGDFYWVNKEQDTTMFAVADCTGHGVSGAMTSMLCNNALNTSVREYGLLDTGDILDKTRELIVKEFEKSGTKDGMDISLCSLNGNTLRYSGANNPLWIVRDNEIMEYKADKQPVGIFDTHKPFTTHTIELQKGDAIYLFTDGYVDQFGGEKGKKLKKSYLKEILLNIQDKPINKQKDIIINKFKEWIGDEEQVDDVCMMGLIF